MESGTSLVSVYELWKDWKGLENVFRWRPCMESRVLYWPYYVEMPSACPSGDIVEVVNIINLELGIGLKLKYKCESHQHIDGI